MNCKQIHALDTLFYTNDYNYAKVSWKIEVNIRPEMTFKDFMLFQKEQTFLSYYPLDFRGVELEMKRNKC